MKQTVKEEKKEKRTKTTFPKSKIRQILKKRAVFESKLNGKPIMRFKGVVYEAFDEIAVLAITEAFDKIAELVRLGRKSTMGETEVESYYKLAK